MCGISGIYQFNQRVDINEMEKFNRSLTHRGPDAQHIFLSQQGNVGLGHCRLSIVDPVESSDQPFLSKDSNLALTFNGEIYNYIELRKELESKGVQFRTNSDTEVLLEAYRYWGAACLDKFNGMWAFAIWDEVQQRLFLARDRFGVKSLYYRKDNDGFAFASEQKAFKAHVYGLAIDPARASDIVQFPEAVESVSATLYQNVSKLLPGEYAYVTANEMFTRRWWNTYDEINSSSQQEPSAEELTELFNDACLLRTRTDVKIATALSGGLDSSAVTSYVAQYPALKEAKELKSYVGSFVDAQMDEFRWAKVLLDAYDLPFERVKISDEDALTHFEDSIFALEDVTTLPAIGQWKIYQSMKSHGYKVSLEGHAGDELLGGYQRHVTVYLGDLLRTRNDVNALAQTIHMLGNMFPERGVNYLKGSILQAPMVAGAIHQNLVTRKRYLDDYMALPCSLTEVDFISERSINSYSQESLLFQKLYEDFHYFSLPNILKNYDRLSMANSVEIRSPFLDYRFVVRAFQASPKLKINDGKNKTLIRNYFTAIPAQVRDRRDKSGFTPPVKRWMKNIFESWINNQTKRYEFDQSNIIDGKMFRATIEKLLNAGEHAQLAQFWPIFNLLMLEEKVR